jgi:hypothetical protein
MLGKKTLMCAALVAAGIILYSWSLHRQESFSTWLAQVQKPEYRLLYSGDEEGRYWAVFDVGDDQVAIFDSCWEVVDRVGAVSIMDSTGRAIFDPDRKRSLLFRVKNFGLFHYTLPAGQVFPIKRRIIGNIRVIYNEASFPRGIRDVELNQMSPVLDIEIPWGQPVGQEKE